MYDKNFVPSILIKLNSLDLISYINRKGHVINLKLKWDLIDVLF